MEIKNNDCKNMDYTDERLVRVDISVMACDYDGLSFLDDVFCKIYELEKVYKISCTPITININ